MLMYLSVLFWFPIPFPLWTIFISAVLSFLAYWLKKLKLVETRLFFSKLTVWVLNVQQWKNQKWCLPRRQQIKKEKWERKLATGNMIYIPTSGLYNCGAPLKVSSVCHASETNFYCAKQIDRNQTSLLCDIPGPREKEFQARFLSGKMSTLPMAISPNRVTSEWAIRWVSR